MEAKQSRQLRLFLCVPVVLSVIAIAAPFLGKPAKNTPIPVDPEQFGLELPNILDRTPPSEQLNLLLKYSDSPQYGIRLAAVEALGERNEARSIEALERSYLDSSSLIRQRVVEQMYDLDPKRGVRFLLDGLRDGDLWIRDAAAMRIASLARLHRPGFDRKLIPDLIYALDDSSDAVVSFAMTSLRHITGKRWNVSSRASSADRGKVIDKWKSWWTGSKQPQGKSIAPTRMEKAPPFEFVDIGGKIVSLDSQRGKITLLNFWGTWCTPCRMEVPELVRVDEELKGRGVEVIGIALAERNGKDGLRKWCSDHGVRYRQAMSQDSVLEAFDHIHEVPVSILIDRQGRVRRRWDGERDFGTFRSAIEACDRN